MSWGQYNHDCKSFLVKKRIGPALRAAGGSHDSIPLHEKKLLFRIVGSFGAGKPHSAKQKQGI